MFWEPMECLQNELRDLFNVTYQLMCVILKFHMFWKSYELIEIKYLL